ncbi:MAG: Phage terminase, small subunit [Syntrophorhabdus sp. PtaU1.Bin050]|jgi:P27 family predicted phage terminase small subunit|nr:MAG: Phage terminase, small subunit [Syntrophorhabdus sp. PtaU1.Bin050]
MIGHKPPKTLSKEGKSLWKQLVTEYGIVDRGGLAILQAGLEALCQMRNAEAIIKSDGLTITDRWGQVKSHPLCSVVRDCRNQYLTSLKLLGVNVLNGGK